MVKRIETVRNEFVEQLQDMLHDSFPKELGFNIEYFIGEDKGKRGLYIELKSGIFGLMYLKKKGMADWELLIDIEDEFMNDVINDFVLAGIRLMNIEAMRKQEAVDLESNVEAEEFKRMMPRLPISVN